MRLVIGIVFVLVMTGSHTVWLRGTVEAAQTPKQYIESVLAGSIIKHKIDPSDHSRAVLFVRAKGKVTEHVLEARLDKNRELKTLRIVTTEDLSSGVAPVVDIPLSTATPCWLKCKKTCGDASECRLDCLFRCILK